MKKAVWLIGLMLAVLCLSGCGGQKGQLKEIRDRGELRVGVKVDVPRFGYINPSTNQLEGLEIDMAKLIAQEIFGNSEAVKLVGITAQTRGPMLANGELDIAIATFTITEERKKSFHFSEPYFHDEVGFLVRKGSTLTALKDLEGKTVGIVQSGTARDALISEAEIAGVTLQYHEYASYPEIRAALLSEKVDAFSADKSILMGYSDEQTVLLADGFNPQDYGIATRLENTELAKYLDELMAAIQKDGRLQEILDRWTVTAP